MMKKLVCIFLLLLVCLLMVGCGNQKTNVSVSEKEKNSTNHTDEITNETAEPTQASTTVPQPITDKDIYSTDTRFVYQANSVAYGVFSHDGTNVTGYEMYIRYDNEEQAKVSSQTYDYSEDDTVASVSTDRNFMVIKYKASEYEGLTVEELKNTYSHLEVLKAN